MQGDVLASTPYAPLTGFFIWGRNNYFKFQGEAYLDGDKCPIPLCFESAGAYALYTPRFHTPIQKKQRGYEQQLLLDQSC